MSTAAVGGGRGYSGSRRDNGATFFSTESHARIAWPDKLPYLGMYKMQGLFVAMSRFAVANDKVEAVKEAFRNRPRLVDSTPGFVRMDVISPEEAPEEIWLVTYWRDRESFLAWHHSEEHKKSHRFIPKGLKLDPKRTKLTYFEQVSD